MWLLMGVGMILCDRVLGGGASSACILGATTLCVESLFCMVVLLGILIFVLVCGKGVSGWLSSPSTGCERSAISCPCVYWLIWLQLR